MTDELQEQLTAAIAVIQEMAAETGVAPSFREYTAAVNGRTHHLEWFRKYHGVTYGAIVRMAGYSVQRSGPKNFDAAAAGERKRAQNETAAYIDRARAARIRQSPWAQEWGLMTVPSSARQEVREVRQPDGTVLRITRTIASLR